MLSLPNGDPRLTEINATGNGTYGPCLQAQGFTTYNRYRRARVTAAKDVLRDVICNVNATRQGALRPREFRLPGGANDPNGGYVRVPIKDYDTPTYSLRAGETGTSSPRTHQQHLDLAINAWRARAGRRSASRCSRSTRTS